MITLLSGTPGSGKSLHMAKDIYWHLQMGRLVVANFEVNTQGLKHPECFLYLKPENMEPGTLEKIAREYFKHHEFREGAISFYWDEAQIMLNSRSWKKNEKWIPFFTQHRKLGYNVFLVCQHHEMLDKQVRTILEYEVMHRKVNNVGLFGQIVNILALGHPVVCGVKRWYGQKMRLSSEFFIGFKKNYKLYDTYKVFEQ